MSKQENLKSLIKEATQAHTNLNVWGSIVTILEGGHIYGGRHEVAGQVIEMCKQQTEAELDIYENCLKQIAELTEKE